MRFNPSSIRTDGESEARQVGGTYQNSLSLIVVENLLGARMLRRKTLIQFH